MAELESEPGRPRHVVLFNFRPEATAEQRERALAVLRSAGNIPTIRAYVVQRNRDPNPSHEWVTVATFASDGARRQTDQNTEHPAKVAEFVHPFITDEVSFDMVL